MFRTITESDLSNILSWRNQDHVRKAMFTDHIITASEHKHWWRKIKDDPNQEWYIYCLDGIDIGVVNFIDVLQNTGSWGFYFSNNLTNRNKLMRAWDLLEDQAIKHAFENTNITTLIAKVFSFNKTVIKMHIKHGFSIIGKELYIRHDVPEEVTVMSIVKPEWKTQQKIHEK